MIFAVYAPSQPLSPEILTSLDREVAGLMDAWVYMTEGGNNSSAGLFMAGTAILRAEAAFEVAVQSDNDRSFCKIRMPMLSSRDSSS